MHAIPNQETNTIVSGFVNNRVWRCQVPIELHSDAEMSRQPHSGICVMYSVLGDIERQSLTHSRTPGRILAKSSERATEGLG